MDIWSLVAFFKWCTVIDGALFILSAIITLAAPGFIYSAYGQLFNLPRKAFNVLLYAFLGLYKVSILAFNLVPFIALLIVEKFMLEIPAPDFTGVDGID